MQFWQGGSIVNLLFLASFLLFAAFVRRLVPQISRWAVPDSVIAGSLGFILGPSVLAALPIDQSMMETLAYHGLAVAFIAVGLQEPVRQKKAGGARSFVFGIPSLGLMQAILGLFFVLAWSAFMYPGDLHPGFGIMVPLGFSQGPGQALALGTAWQTAEVPLGQIGLTMAAFGFGWCCFIGVVLVGIARKRGWLTPLEESKESANSGSTRDVVETAPPGGQEPLARAVASIAAVYLLTYGVLVGLSTLLEAAPKQQRLIWGFHFIIASLLAIACRKMVAKLGGGSKKLANDTLLSRLAGLVVDFTTVAALCAIQLEVLEGWLLPIAVVTLLAGLLTVTVSMWLAKRAFPESPFEHALVLFGVSTGNLPTGLTLLRIIDPELKGPVASNVVLGASAAVIPGAPMLLLLMPYAIDRFPAEFPGAVWVNLAMMIGYLLFVIVLWRFLAPLRFIGPLTSFWPSAPTDDESGGS